MRDQMEGSRAIAETVARCRPQVVPAYPITPQTHMVEAIGAKAKSGAIDKEPYRLQMAERAGHTPVNFDEVDVRSTLLELTGGRGPDKCIDAVGMESTHGSAHIDAYDRVKQAVRSETERPHALRQAILSCRSGGVVSVIGVYGGLLDKFPADAWMNRALTLRTGQCTCSAT